MTAKYSKWPPKFHYFNKTKEGFLIYQSMFMSSNWYYVNYQLNGTRCANYQFKMADKYSKWRPKNSKWRPKFNKLNKLKKCSVKFLMDWRLEHIYKFKIILWQLLTETKWMTHNLWVINSRWSLNSQNGRQNKNKLFFFHLSMYMKSN